MKWVSVRRRHAKGIFRALENIFIHVSIVWIIVFQEDDQSTCEGQSMPVAIVCLCRSFLWRVYPRALPFSWRQGEDFFKNDVPLLDGNMQFLCILDQANMFQNRHKNTYRKAPCMFAKWSVHFSMLWCLGDQPWWPVILNIGLHYQCLLRREDVHAAIIRVIHKVVDWVEARLCWAGIATYWTVKTWFCFVRGIRNKISGWFASCETNIWIGRC